MGYKMNLELSTSQQCIIYSFMALLFLLCSQNALAASGTGTDAIASVLCVIVTALQGTIGKGVATIAIVVLGIGLFLGKLSWPLAVATAIGIGMIFGASDMVSWISSGASKDQVCPTS